MVFAGLDTATTQLAELFSNGFCVLDIEPLSSTSRATDEKGNTGQQPEENLKRSQTKRNIFIPFYSNSR